MVSKQKEIFNNLADEKLEEITRLDKTVNPDGLIYRYIGSTSNEKFHEFDHALIFLGKIRDDKISLADAKNDQAEFISNLSEIKKETKNINQMNKKYIV